MREEGEKEAEEKSGKERISFAISIVLLEWEQLGVLSRRSNRKREEEKSSSIIYVGASGSWRQDENSTSVSIILLPTMWEPECPITHSYLCQSAMLACQFCIYL